MNLMWVLTMLYFCILIVLEVVNLFGGRKDRKHFKAFNGMWFAFILSMIIYAMYISTDLYTYDTSEWDKLIPAFSLVMLFVINLIIGVISLILQVVYKKKDTINTSKIGETLKYFLLVTLCSLIFIVGQFMFRYFGKVKIDNEVKEEALSYLKEKYGTEEFEIVDIDREFGYNGFMSDGNINDYNVSVKYKPSNISFNIRLDVKHSYSFMYFGIIKINKKVKVSKSTSKDNFATNIYNIYLRNYEDNFLGDVLKEKDNLQNYLKENNISVMLLLNKGTFDYWKLDDIIPNNYGKIITKEDLYKIIIDYQMKHELEVVIDSSEVSSEGLREYLINLSSNIIKYYKEVNGFEIICNYNGDKGTLKIDNEYIYINVKDINDKIKR